jgi:hypothetical protein
LEALTATIAANDFPMTLYVFEELCQRDAPDYDEFQLITGLLECVERDTRINDLIIEAFVHAYPLISATIVARMNHALTHDNRGFAASVVRYVGADRVFERAFERSLSLSLQYVISADRAVRAKSAMWLAVNRQYAGRFTMLAKAGAPAHLLGCWDRLRYIAARWIA